MMRRLLSFAAASRSSNCGRVPRLSGAAGFASKLLREPTMRQAPKSWTTAVFVAAVLAVIFLHCPAALAQSHEIDYENRRFRALFQAGRYAEALSMAERGMVLRKLVYPDPVMLRWHSNIAAAYRAQGRHADAEPHLKEAIAIYEKTSHADHPDVAGSLSSLAEIYWAQGRYADAERLHKQALAIREKALGPNHPDVGASLNSLAWLYQGQGRYADAEPLYKRLLAIREKALGPDDLAVATSLDDLAPLYYAQGRYADAEPLYERALAIYEKALGPYNFAVEKSLSNLAKLYQDQGRYADAEPLYKRSLAIYEKALDPDDPDVAAPLNDLAVLYSAQSRYADAEPIFRRSLAIAEKAFGPEHPNVAALVNNLAVLYINQGRYTDAEPLNKRALAISEKALGSDHPAVGASLNNLAGLYQRQGRYADAEPLYRRALGIREKALGPNHPDVAVTLSNLAELYGAQGRYADALPLVQTTIARGRARHSVALSVLLSAQGAGLISADKGLDDALNVVQRAARSLAAAAVNKAAVRLSAGSERLARLVRKDQDLAAEAGTLDTTIIAAASKEPAKRDGAVEQRIRDRLAAIAAEREALRKVFAAEFPDYAALLNPQPSTVKEVQSLLSDDEVLVLFAPGDRESYVFALTRADSVWKAIPLDAQALSQKVAAFRHGLDTDALSRGLGRVECTQAEADKRGLSRTECDKALAAECARAGADGRGLGRAECRYWLFDLAVAHELYQALIGPVEALVKEKHDLLVVPAGALTALPFHLLVTAKPAAAVPASRNPADLVMYRDAAWLLKRHAVTVLPAVASLRALRTFGRKDQAGKPMIGFGDPVFDPNEPLTGAGQRSARRGVNTRAFTDFWHGADGDRAQLSSLPRLADTADELKAIAKSLGVPAGDIHLRADASEETVKRMPLADYRIVYFATHGLVAGDVKELGEPSLALTTPAQPSDIDDGLLTASEVAQLKLNADWVVLSACNTIAGDKPGAEALSGLARAFFYAGARTLLVSHWSVDSNAATRLTTTTFDYLKADPTVGRAEALRRAMLAYMNDASDPRNSYPAYWAPFELVGEGAANVRTAAPQPAQAMSPPGAMTSVSKGPEEVAQTVRRAVVAVRVNVNGGVRQGSGFFISPDGYAVTNNVIADAGNVQVATNDGKTYTAKIVGTDPRSDLALLKVDGVGLPYVRLADSSPRVGDPVFAVGNPGGLGSTVTAGKVAALDHNIGGGPHDDFIEIDGPAKAGNNGGPTVGIDGDVVGVTVVILNPAGGATGTTFYAIPSAMVKSIVGQLKEYGSVERASIGMRFQALTKEISDALGLRNPVGALVVAATAGGPAAAAGIEPRDVVKSLDGEVVTNDRDLTRKIGGMRPGVTVSLVVMHGQVEKTVTVTLARLPQTPRDEWVTIRSSSPFFGSTVANLSAALAEELHLDSRSEGVVILQIEDGSTAKNAGFQRGDVVISVNQEKIAKTRDLERVTKNPRRAWQFTLLRKGQTISVTLGP
jgi:S1-C subfamily serine protease/CHAT domain-containing protein/tetratricopeptide (TPR) repeat protein